MTIDGTGRVVSAESGDLISSVDNAVVILGPGNSSDGGRYNTVLGVRNSSVGTNFNTLVGLENVAQDSLNVMYGTNNTTTSRLGVFIGDANVNLSPKEILTEACVLVGSGNTVSDQNKIGNHIIVGSGSQVSCKEEVSAPCIVMGHLNTATGGNNVVISPVSSECKGADSVAIGTGCHDNGYQNVLMLGHGLSATDSNQIAIGSEQYPYSTKESVPRKRIEYLEVLLNGKLVAIPYYR
jgi:carbonic anhydrase/acetyltransferase-like protein (isoleucine patch superfamily)